MARGFVLITALLPYIIAAAMAFGAGWSINGWRLAVEISHLQQAQAESISKGVSDALTATNAMQQRAASATRAADERNRSLSAGAANARAESERLRADLSKARADIASATRASLDNYTAALGLVFAECTRAYQELAVSADGHASDVLTLKMSWPK